MEPEPKKVEKKVHAVDVDERAATKKEVKFATIMSFVGIAVGSAAVGLHFLNRRDKANGSTE
jgi:hypothetical protein